MLKLFIWETIEESQSNVMNILLPSLEANVRKRRPVYNTGTTGQESAFTRWRIVLPLPV